MISPIPLIDDASGLVRLYPDWCSVAGLFERLQRTVDWQSRTISLYGKDHLIPRLEAWVGQQDVAYQYSGQHYSAQGWPVCLNPLVEKLTEERGWSPNGALLNYYRGGHDTMGWHADDEPELGHNPSIAILSLGTARTFKLRAKTEKSRVISVDLPPGSLLWMSGATQHYWQHSLPKRAHKGPRISVTFRQIKV